MIELLVLGVVIWLIYRALRSAAWRRKMKEIEAALHNVRAIDPRSISYRPTRNETVLGEVESVDLWTMQRGAQFNAAILSHKVDLSKDTKLRFYFGGANVPAKSRRTDRGRLVITDQALCFEGPKRNVRLTWSSLAEIDYSDRAIRVQKRTGGPSFFKARFSAAELAAVEVADRLYQRKIR